MLTSLIAQEDCASRSLVKGDPQGKTKDEQPKEDAEENDDNDNKLEDEEDEEESSALDTEEAAKSTSGSQQGPSEYLQNKQRNIEELKRRLDEVKAKYPVPKDLEPKQGLKSSALKRKTVHSNEPVVRRESLRNKDKM